MRRAPYFPSPFPLFSPAPFLLFTFSLLLLLVACTAPNTQLPPTSTLAPTLTQTPTPALSPTLAPSATATPTTRPTRRPTITIAPTRTPIPTATNLPVNWLVDWPIAELSANNLNLQPWQETWLNGNTLSLSQDGHDYQIQITNEQVSEPFLLPVPTPLFAYPSSVSPAENFAVECAPERLNLYRLPSREMIGQFETIVQSCQSMRWRSDETALSFTNAEERVFIWETNLLAPREVGTGTAFTPVPWSPDGSKIFVFVGELEFQLWVIDMNGQAYETGITTGWMNWDPGFVHWVTNNIIGDFVYGSQYFTQWFYDANTGEQLIEVETGIGRDGVRYGQSAWISPDNHWMFIERPLDEIPPYVYQLFDLTTEQIFLLADSTSSYLPFFGWTSDSTRFYLLSRPVDAATSPNLSLPSGLLALNPNTRQFTQIIPGALYATLNPQQTHVFTLLPENDHLTAALHTLSGDLLATFQPITDDIPYLTPGEGLPIPAAWSNDGTRIVFSDVWGDLWLADTSGALTQLADNLGFDPAYPRQPQFSWSPDDSHLLITFHDRAWVVTLP